MKASKTNIDLASLAQSDARCTEMEQALKADSATPLGRAERHWTLEFQADGDKPGDPKGEE